MSSEYAEQKCACGRAMLADEFECLRCDKLRADAFEDYVDASECAK